MKQSELKKIEEEPVMICVRCGTTYPASEKVCPNCW